MAHLAKSGNLVLLATDSSISEKLSFSFTAVEILENDEWGVWDREILVVYSADFNQFLKPFIELIYPRIEENFEAFDFTGINPISKVEWQTVLTLITNDRENKASDPEFMQLFFEWITNKLKQYDEIVIESNL